MLNDFLECRIFPAIDDEAAHVQRTWKKRMLRYGSAANGCAVVTRRKAALIAAVRNHEITLEEACRQYQLSPGEFAGWLAAFEKHGAPGLRATRFQIYRDKPRSPHATWRGGF